MDKEFCNYETALELKELGFNEPCLMYIDDEGDYIIDDTAEWLGAVKAPLKQQVFRWFRENYNWTIKVNQVTKNNWSYTLDNFPKDRTYYGEVYKTYEEAESACIDKLIEIVKNI